MAESPAPIAYEHLRRSSKRKRGVETCRAGRAGKRFPTGAGGVVRSYHFCDAYQRFTLTRNKEISERVSRLFMTFVSVNIVVFHRGGVPDASRRARRSALRFPGVSP
jgi:hypothetical protein